MRPCGRSMLDMDCPFEGMQTKRCEVVFTRSFSQTITHLLLRVVLSFQRVLDLD